VLDLEMDFDTSFDVTVQTAQIGKPKIFTPSDFDTVSTEDPSLWNAELQQSYKEALR